MPKNVLFNFIESYLSESTSSVPNCKQLKKNCTQTGINYFHFELPTDHSTILNDDPHKYELMRHHMSVYETESSVNPFLSQYHYTAYFEDENRAKYRVHVYFNDNNDLLIKPIFSIWKEPNSYTTLKTNALDEHFVSLALNYVSPVIRVVRRQLALKVNELETQYKTLEIAASKLSMSLPENTKLYGLKLDEILETLQRLNPLVNNPIYQAVQKIIIRTRALIIDTYQTQPFKGPKQKEEQVTETSALEANLALGSNGQVLELTQTHETSELDKKIKELASQSELLTGSDELYQTKLNELLGNALALLLESEFNDEAILISLDSLTLLNKVYQKLIQSGEQFFARLVIGGKYSIAKELTSFYYLLDNYLSLALQTRNPELLDFILNHGTININNHEVSVKGSVYSSAVECCFVRHNDKNPMDACLSVLLKHGASIFGIDSDGVPIAHIILSNPSHPFQKVLIEHREKTINSISFYKRLISLLKLNIEKNKDSSEHERDESTKDLLTEINKYQNRIKELQQDKVPANTTEKILEKDLIHFSQEHKTPIFDQLHKEPELIALVRDLQKETTLLRTKLPHKDRRAYAQKSSKYIENLDKMIKHYNIKFDDYETVKLNTFEYLRNRLELIRKEYVLIDIRTTIQSYMVKPGQEPRKYKQLIAQQAQLITEIKDLESKVAIPKAEQADTIPQIRIDDMSKLLSIFDLFQNEETPSAKKDIALSVLEQFIEKSKIKKNQSPLSIRHNLFSASIRDLTLEEDDEVESDLKPEGLST